MRKQMIALVFLSVTIAGCGQAEEAANRAFDENFLSSCLSSATGGAIPAEVAEAACNCALTKINETYSATEKLTLSSEQAMPIAEQCFAEVVQQAG